jgi:Pentapeptide repeats (8 copies)
MPYNLPMARAGWRWRPSAVGYAALGLAGLVGLVGIVLLIWRVPPALYAYVPDPKDRAAAEASTRTGLIAGLAGLGALGSLAIATRTYRLTQQGQITDRYTKAIEQLGSDKLDVRLGGIYALERIAADSPRDHPTVVEVLSAFVREHGQPPTSPTGALLSVKPASDVQAALDVLGRLPQRSGVSRGDLSAALVAFAGLRRANLSGAVLNETYLPGAVLLKANLSGASLILADLSGAVLEGADLSGARLYEADLSGAHLEGADLSGAVLDGVDLQKAYGLTQAQLNIARGDANTQLPDGLRRPASWEAEETSTESSS